MVSGMAIGSLFFGHTAVPLCTQVSPLSSVAPPSRILSLARAFALLHHRLATRPLPRTHDVRGACLSPRLEQW